MGTNLKNELPQTLDQTVREFNKHLHEMLKRLPHLSAARVKHHYESFLLPFQIRGNLLASGKKKERKNEKRKRRKNRKEKRGNPAWSMIYLWNQENSSPLKWYFSWVLTLQSSSSLGIHMFLSFSLLHVFLNGFHYYMTHHSPQSTVLRSQQGCPCPENFPALNSELMLCLAWTAEQFLL